jgi:hypothetical protein
MGVNMAPDSRTLWVELINYEVTPLKNMLLTDDQKIEKIIRKLITLTNVRPYLRDSTKAYKL